MYDNYNTLFISFWHARNHILFLYNHIFFLLLYNILQEDADIFFQICFSIRTIHFRLTTLIFLGKLNRMQ